MADHYPNLSRRRHRLPGPSLTGQSGLVAAILTLAAALHTPLALPDPNITAAWVGRYDGGLNDEPAAIAVDQTGAAYVTGLSGGSGTYDVLTVKYDPGGRELWSARFNGPANAYDEGTAIVVNNSGQVFVAGASETAPADMDFTVLSYDADTGVLLWSNTLNGADVPTPACASSACTEAPDLPVNDRAEALALMTDGGVVVAGTISGPSGYDYFTARLSPQGELQWARRYDGPGHGSDHAAAIATDSKHNIVVTGRSRGATHYDMATVKYDPDGNLLWAHRYDGPIGWYDAATAVAIAADDRVLVAGTSFGRWRHTAGVVMAYSSTGQRQWVTRPFDDHGSSSLERIGVDRHGALVGTGSIGIQGNWNYLTFKLDRSGRLRWVAEYDGPGQGIDRARALGLDAAGNAFVSGVTDMTDDPNCEACPAFTTVKYASGDGEVLWVARYAGPRAGANRASALRVHGEHVLVTGMSAGATSARGRIGDGPRDYALLKYEGVADSGK